MTEPESIGHYLRTLREQQSLSLEDVEEATRIRVEILRAVESGESTNRVPAAYAKGFIKTYAEFLGADSAELAERFKGMHMDVSPEMGIPAVAALARGRRAALSRRALLLLVIGVGALVAAVIVYCFQAEIFWRYKLTVRAVGRVPIRVYRDDKFIWGTTIEPGKEKSWRGKKSVKLKISRPENARVICRGRTIRLPEGEIVSVIFDHRGIDTKIIARWEEPARPGI